MSRLVVIALCAAILAPFVGEPVLAQEKAACQKLKLCDAGANKGNFCKADAACPGGKCKEIEAYACPNVNNPPQPQCEVKDKTFADSKDGKWKKYCTNEGPGGNWAWDYDENGAKGPKRVGKCDREQGRNSDGYLADKDNKKQIIGFWQICMSTKHKKCVGGANSGKLCENDSDCPGSTCGGSKLPYNERADGNERTVRIFSPKKMKFCAGGANMNKRCNADADCPGSTCKEIENKGLEWKENKAKMPHPGDWQYIPDTRREYTSLTTSYNNGDPPTSFELADYSATLRLAAIANGTGALDILWKPYVEAYPPWPSPILKAGGTVYIDRLSVGSIVSLDTRFTPSSAPEGGLQLTANTDVGLITDGLLATVTRPDTSELFYAVLDTGVVEFMAAGFNGAPVGGELKDTPLYASTVGTLVEEPVPVPAVRGWVMFVLVSALLFTAGVFVSRRPMERGA